MPVSQHPHGRFSRRLDTAKSTSVSMYFHLYLTSHLIRPGPLQPYLHKARWIAQSIHPFINIQRVFFAGVPEAALDAEDENEEEPAEYVPTSCLT